MSLQASQLQAQAVKDARPLWCPTLPTDEAILLTEDLSQRAGIADGPAVCLHHFSGGRADTPIGRGAVRLVRLEWANEVQ